MFPKEIRGEGKYYKVNDTDIRLANRMGNKPFYSIKRTNILVMTDQEKQQLLNPTPTDISNMTIFDAGDCVICLSSVSSIVFIPCGHRCTCSLCNQHLKQAKYCCPVCREKITEDIVG